MAKKKKKRKKKKKTMASDQSQTTKPVPVTLISGFLGSGKTTLVNYILSEHHGKRIAVIQNEFGDQIGIEEAMTIKDQDGKSTQQWLELPNGCLCCSVRDDLVVTIENLLEKKESKFDYILIETTGLADPGRVASIFWLDDQLESRLYLDAVVILVDSKKPF
mmetsp:Transcript_7997/g.12145  ORF Transcript_7997/g.12145 Transcript_7997/m.12145 type:complete len:162 (-) Transcript_7997:3-488(-)